MLAQRLRRSNRFCIPLVIILLSAALLPDVAPAQSGSATQAVLVHADKKIGNNPENWTASAPSPGE